MTRRSGSSDLGDAILQAASELLAEEGPAGLTVRHIAERAGCSTMGVYSHFGGKEGVFEALLIEGFDLLADQMKRVRSTDDPLADLRRCLHAYRQFALHHATHYIVMFGRPLPDYELSPEAVEHALGTLALLEERVQRCLDAGVFDPSHGDAVTIAHSIWSTSHGLVGLELAGMGRVPVALVYEATTETLLAGLRQPAD